MANFLRTKAGMLLSGVPHATRHPTQIGTTGMGPPDGATAIAAYSQDMATLGNTLDRTYLSMNVCNPADGVFNWTNRQGAPDLWYNASLGAGRRIILQPIFAPEWWMAGVGVSWTHSDRPYADLPPFPSADANYYLAQYAKAATAAATQYPSSLVTWEPGNEWNNAGIYHRPGGLVVAMPVTYYAAYFAAWYNAVKAVNPAQQVIIGGMFRMDSAPAFGGNGNFSGNSALAPLKVALDALGVTPDGVASHPYMLGNSSSDPAIDRGPNTLGITSWQSVGRTLDEMDRIGWHLPLYLTETGFRGSQSNSQNSFNCNSETTKTLWNRYEHDNMFFLYAKDARPAGKAWVEAMMYYRDQEYPSPTASSYSGAISGDPAGGPHALTEWGTSKIDFVTRTRDHLHLPILEGLTLSCPSTAVIGQAPVTITAAGLNVGAVPYFRTTDPTVGAVTTPPIGSTSSTLSFPGAGEVSIWVFTYSATRAPQVARQKIVVAAQIPTLSAITPGDGWKIATSNSGTLQFVVSETDQIGNPIVTPAGVWTSSDPTNAPINASGLLTAVGVVAGVVISWAPTGGAPGSGATSTGDVVLNPVLQIVNAPATLINVGATPIQVTDGANPVTGFTLIISDASKATASGSDLFGKGTSGTFTLSASKGGYTNASLATITCTGGGYLDDKDTYGFTNGVGVATYTDPAGNTWAQATSGKRPIANTNDLNSHTSLTYDGVDDFLQAAAPVSHLNGSGVTYASLRYPTSASVAANEQQLDNRDTTNFQGFVFGRNAGTLTPTINYYTAPGTLTQKFDGSSITANVWHIIIDRVNQGEQSRMVDGVVVGTSDTAPVYRYPTTAPPRPTKGGSIFLAPGNNAAEHVAAEILVNRACPDVERLQLHYWLTLYAAGSVIPSAPLSMAMYDAYTDQADPTMLNMVLRVTPAANVATVPPTGYKVRRAGTLITALPYVPGATQDLIVPVSSITNDRTDTWTVNAYISGNESASAASASVHQPRRGWVGYAQGTGTYDSLGDDMFGYVDSAAVAADVKYASPRYIDTSNTSFDTTNRWWNRSRLAFNQTFLKAIGSTGTFTNAAPFSSPLARQSDIYFRSVHACDSGFTQAGTRELIFVAIDDAAATVSQGGDSYIAVHQGASSYDVQVHIRDFANTTNYVETTTTIGSVGTGYNDGAATDVCVRITTIANGVRVRVFLAVFGEGRVLVHDASYTNASIGAAGVGAVGYKMLDTVTAGALASGFRMFPWEVARVADSPSTFATMPTTVATYARSLPVPPPIPPVLTSVSVAPSSATGPIGTTQQYVAQSKDQTGSNYADTHTYTVDTPAVATINSTTGIATRVANGSAIVTATSNTDVSKSGTAGIIVAVAASLDTTAYNATTGAGIGGSTGAAPTLWDTAKRYSSDADFRTNIGYNGPGNTLDVYSNSALKGTAPIPSDARYNDGQFPDLISRVTTGTLYSGDAVFEATIVGRNTAESSPSTELYMNMNGTNIYSGWTWRRVWYPIGFETSGDATGAAATWNATQGDGYKIGCWLHYDTGRTGRATAGGNKVAYNNPSNTGGIPETAYGALITPQWTDGAWYDELDLAVQEMVSGVAKVSFTSWRRKQGDATFTQHGTKLGPVNSGSATLRRYGGFSWGGLNYNRSRLTNLTCRYWGGAFWDLATNANPFSVTIP